MDNKQLEEYIQKLQREAPEIINEIYASLDLPKIEMTKKTLRERTGRVASLFKPNFRFLPPCVHIEDTVQSIHDPIGIAT